jgi:hypothetical protein
VTCLVVPTFCQHVAGEVYALGERVRDPDAPGFEFECVAAGQAGPKTPRFKGVRAAGETLTNDGACSWLSRVISNSSLARTIQSATWEADALVAITEQADVRVGGEQKTRANLAAAQPTAAGNTYRVLCKVAFTDGTAGVGIADVEFDT